MRSQLLHTLLLVGSLALYTCAEPRRAAEPATRSRGGDPQSEGAHADAPRGAQVTDPRKPAGATPGGAQGSPQSSRMDFSTSRPVPEKLALLIGIDAYAPGTPASFQKLQGCVRDTERVRELLEQRFEFPPEDILTLTNAEATHENIVRAFHEWLILRAGPETEVLFWYSGHGSLVPDQSGVKGAELGGKDSTLVAYDSRARGEQGAYDISDDEVRSLLYALTRKTSRVTVVTDSCHSGGATRGVATYTSPRVRAAADGTVPVDFARLKASFWPADIELSDEDRAKTAEPERYVHIAACTSAQSAQEIDTLDDKGEIQAHGALTFFLTQCLENAEPRASYRALADDAAVRLSTRLPSQNVTREGALDREVFGARFRPRPTGFLARVLPEGEIQVEAGSMHGLKRDSVVKLFDPRRDEPVGRATITRAGALSAFARWIDTPPTDVSQIALRAVEESRPDRQDPLVVFVTDPRLAALLAGSERVRIEREDPRRAGYELAVEQADAKLTLVGPDGLKIWKEAEAGSPIDANLGATLEDVFREELRYQAIVALAEMRGTIQLEAEFVSPTAERFAEFAHMERVTDAEPRPMSDGRAAYEYRALGTLADPQRELSLAVLRVKNPTQRDVYLSVFSASEDRARNPIFPRPGVRDNILAAGEETTINVNVVAHPRWNLSRPMRDRYLIIATLEPADFTPLTYAAQLRSGGSASAGMPELLSTAIVKPNLRGAKPIRPDTSGFGVTTVDLWVEKLSKP